MRKIVFGILLMLPVVMTAQNWDYIRESGEYYYGVGHGTNEQEASERAMADLIGMIATNVSSEFQYLMDEKNENGKLEHQSRVHNCIKTYSTTTLTNVEKWILGKEPNIQVRRYIKRSEMAKIYEDRETKAQDMVKIAEEALKKGKIDMALQYYYWAYSLIRSVQRPNMVKDDEGRVLVNMIPQNIEDILSDISVKYEKRDGDCVDLLFNYKDHPVSSLEFTYSDGRTECLGSAKDGRGMIEMVPGYNTDTYHINIEYEHKGQARGDAEMQSVLDVITKKVFKGAAVTYANATKTKVLGVPSEMIEKCGVVSQDVVESMATGVRSLMDADYGVATTGIAGPSGGTDENPVGTVWIGVASASGVVSKCFNFGKDRENIINRATIAAYEMLRQELIG